MVQPTISDETLDSVISLLQQLVWADKETRVKLQRHGVNVLPVNFYGSTPSLEEIETSYEYTTAEPPYLNPDLFQAGVMQATLEKLLPLASEFRPPMAGDEAKAQRFFWQNSQFGYSDAMAYYCFVRLLQPTTILEIGSGFSTLVALDAIERNGRGMIRCIEPFPRPFLEENPHITLRKVKAQEIRAEFLNDTLHDGDILFIDSTHTVKTGNDCLHIYLRLLPALHRRVFVHVHDIFLPFGLPQEWLLDLQIFWTEQYLLMAFLTDNPKATVLYGSNYHAHWNKPLLDELMGGQQPSGGGSLWFMYDGTQRK